MVIAGRLVAVLLGLLLAAQVVRVAAVRAWAPAAPQRAVTAWPGYPSAEIELGLIAIAGAARLGRPVDAATLARMSGASARAPLAPDPFLVRGVQAQLAGDSALAERAFIAARQREGRSLPARYFLADLYLRNGDAKRGLAEVSALARLVPNGIDKLAPYVATFARDRRNWPVVRDMFAREPDLEAATLRALAGNAGTADVVLALADPRRSNAKSPWLLDLLGSLTANGQYSRARQIWAEVTGAQSSGPIFDPDFKVAGPPPPFNWTLTSSTRGLAERQAGRGLHIIYYGQEDGALATQLLVLAPGRYRLLTDAPGLPSGADSLRWTLVCARGNTAIASAPLDKAVAEGVRFIVPASCPAQRLELVGVGAEMPRQADLAIRSVSLARE